MTRHKNPPVSGLACVVCGAAAASAAHEKHRGMGGDPKGLRTLTHPMCGSGGNHNGYSCHDLGIETREIGDEVQFRPSWRAAQWLRSLPQFRDVPVLDGEWQTARFAGRTWEEVGEL